mgnify:CR=1 FL=1
MFKAILMADIHLKDTEPIGKFDSTGLSLRTLDKLNALERVFNFAIEKQVDSIFILGDLFNSCNPSNRLRLEFSKRLLPVVEKQIKVVILGGNHDTSDGRFFNFMSEAIYNSYIYFVKSKKIKVNGWTIYCASWGYEDSIDSNIEDKAILLAHTQIIGAKYDSERISDKFYAPERFKQFKRVYLGHFHKRQKIENIQYIGALCRNDFGERDNPEGFLYLELNDTISETYISINDRQFIQLELDVTSEDGIYEALGNMDLKDAIVKLKINLQADIIVKKNKVRKFLETKQVFDSLIEFYRPKFTRLAKVSINKDLSMQKTLDNFIKQKQITKELALCGKNLLEEVMARE